MAAPEDANIELPDKLNNQNSIRSIQQNVDVVINGYQMDLRQAVPQVYQFELKFFYQNQPRRQQEPSAEGGEVQKWEEVARGNRNDESKETRRRLGWQLFQQFLQQHFPKAKPRAFVYDCALLLYCIQDLGMQPDQSIEFLLTVDKNSLEQRCRAYVRRADSFKATLLRTQVSVNLRNQGDRSLVQFLELLSSQRLFEQGKFYCFGNKFYDQDDAITLMPHVPHILKKGLQKNVRFVGDSVADATPILQIDPKKSAFFPGIELLEFVCNLLNTDARQLEQDIWQRGYIYQQVNKQIKQLALETRHLVESQMTFVNMGLSDQPCNRLTFMHEGQPISVVDYFARKYNWRIRYPELPCVIRRTRAGDAMFPMETLVISQGQRVPMDKQTPRLTEQMIRQCQVLPADLGGDQGQIAAQKEAAHLQSSNPFFRAHNVRVDSGTLMRAKANALYPPAIQFVPREDVVEPDRQGGLRDWKMVGQGPVIARRNYVLAAEWPRVWAVVIVQGAVPVDLANQFVKVFVETAQRRGMAGAFSESGGGKTIRKDNWPEATMEYVNDQFQHYKQSRCQFVLVLADDKQRARPGDIHHVVKLMEQKHTILTQHVGPRMVEKALGKGGGGRGGGGGPGGAAMVLENIMFKTNLKLGGINWSLTTSGVFKQAAGIRHDILGQQWLGGKRMFFGLDMSHPPSQPLFDRKSKTELAIPTIVGMAYTVGSEALNMAGTYWMQPARQATILGGEHQRRPFIDNIKTALRKYEARNDTFPEHLIIFRGGASEGEFKKISHWEGNAFVEAFQEIAAERRAQIPEPAVTLIVCQRQSNYRVIPATINRGASAPEQNVRPGTVVDKGVMSAALTEFLLVAHKALQGTAQPVRCTVVREHRPPPPQTAAGPAVARIPARMPLEELENITNALCYSHGICCTPTALPGPLLEAAELAKRGRNNWKTQTNDGVDGVHQFDLQPQQATADMDPELQAQAQRERAEHFATVSQEFKPQLDTKFWA